MLIVISYSFFVCFVCRLCVCYALFLLGQMQIKHGDDVTTIVSQTMDLLEAGDTIIGQFLAWLFGVSKTLTTIQWGKEQTQGFIKTTKA